MSRELRPGDFVVTDKEEVYASYGFKPVNYFKDGKIYRVIEVTPDGKSFTAMTDMGEVRIAAREDFTWQGPEELEMQWLAIEHARAKVQAVKSKPKGKSKNKIELNEGHMLELLDRTHCISESFQSFVADHPASDLVKVLVTEVQDKLGELYQQIGQRNHDMFGK